MIETVERKTQQPVGAWYVASAAARWIAAAIAIFYGFAKVNGAYAPLHQPLCYLPVCSL